MVKFRCTLHPATSPTAEQASGWTLRPGIGTPAAEGRVAVLETMLTAEADAARMLKGPEAFVLRRWVQNQVRAAGGAACWAETAQSHRSTAAEAASATMQRSAPPLSAAPKGSVVAHIPRCPVHAPRMQVGRKACV